MKAIKCDLPAELDHIDILPLADLHIGDGCCNWKLVQELLARVKDDPHCYCILSGDLMDSAIASSIGDTYASTHSPMEQLRECVKLFQPIAHKILSVVAGNHENRVYRMDGIDTTELMCSQLGIADRYSPTTALLFVRFGRPIMHHGRKNGKVLYTLYQTHGNGGGRKEGGKINRLADYATIVDADCYISAHTHLPAVFKTGYYRTDSCNSSIAYIEKTFVNTASALDYGGYGDKQGFKPASNSYPVITLFSGKKKIQVML